MRSRGQAGRVKGTGTGYYQASKGKKNRSREISYDEAVEILKKNGIDFQWGNDLGGADETVIGDRYDRPVMIHRYPSEVKAFYMKRDPENPKVALAVDVIARKATAK